MGTFASLVVGSDGSTSLNGSSQAISSVADRELFLSRRRAVDFLLIGGQTARAEPYLRTPVPVVVASRSEDNVLATNPDAYWWNLSPAQALTSGIAKFGPSVLVESGGSFLSQLISEKVLDGIFLTVTKISGGENRIDIENLLDNFLEREEKSIGDTLFITARKPK